VRGRVADLVRRHGGDTLSAFKLRGDLRYLLDAGGRACVGYRVVRGVLLIAGDPVGPPEALPGLLADVRAFAREHGLRVGAVNASAAFRALAAGAGLRALYLGDEAIVDTAGFGGPGRPLRKKVRQAVRRVERAGLRADLRPVAALGQEEVAALAAVAERWRRGAPDRGFSTAMDRLVTQELPDAIVVVALDAGGRPRGFLHYLPAYGRHAMSLSAMCRDPDTPNGTMEYLLVRSIERLRERGVAEVSLNYAAFARWLHAPASRAERALGRIVALADPFFQIESLYRFNAKLGPRWEPRYLLYERLPALPRTVLAALSAEGHLPRPRLPRPTPRAPRRRRAGALVRGALGIAGCVLAVLAGVGWLYLLRHAGALRAGPPVREALPLQRLAGGARQPLARLLAAWVPAGVVAGLALGLTPVGRAGRALAAGAIAFGFLAVLGWASDGVTASETLRFTPQLGRAALWLAAGLVALGALIPPPRGRRPAASAEEARAAGAMHPGTGGAAAP
jgi:hypothetical protein